MRKFLLYMAMAVVAFTAVADDDAEYYRVYQPFYKTVFYDGYNETVFDKGLNDGILRHRNSYYAKKLTDSHLDWFGLDTKMEITIGALCDNYDRIGNISLALVPKGQEAYNPDEVQRIELARFITPFMNKNKLPDEVPYSFDANLMSMIFHDLDLRDKYDLWLEFELFGIPYAANQSISGCEGRNDVFAATLKFVSYDEPAKPNRDHVLVPIVMKKPEYKGHNFNNYSEMGTDTIGTATKTYKFVVPEGGVADSNLTLIMSNHGANAHGEEYNPRLHLLYFDGELIATWKNGKSCEPYRYYNTQANGIYGTFVKNEKVWKSQSNWCPGDAIPVRVFGLGNLPAGEHEVMIRVPDAVFADEQGDFPVSMYFQASKSGQLPVGIDENALDADSPRIVRNGDVVRLEGGNVSEISIYSYDGALLYGRHTSDADVSLVGLARGIYLVNFTLTDGTTFTYKAIKN